MTENLQNILKSTGINCVEYKNGSRHTLAEYADMAIRTASVHIFREKARNVWSGGYPQ